MATANLNFSLGSHWPQAAKVCHVPCSVSVLRQAIHKLVLSVAPGNIGALDMQCITFPPQGEAGCWGFSTASSMLGWEKELFLFLLALGN